MPPKATSSLLDERVAGGTAGIACASATSSTGGAGITSGSMDGTARLSGVEEVSGCVAGGAALVDAFAVWFKPFLEVLAGAASIAAIEVLSSTIVPDGAGVTGSATISPDGSEAISAGRMVVVAAGSNSWAYVEVAGVARAQASAARLMRCVRLVFDIVAAQPIEIESGPKVNDERSGSSDSVLHPSRARTRARPAR